MNKWCVLALFHVYIYIHTQIWVDKPIKTPASDLLRAFTIILILDYISTNAEFKFTAQEFKWSKDSKLVTWPELCKPIYNRSFIKLNTAQLRAENTTHVNILMKICLFIQFFILFDSNQLQQKLHIDEKYAHLSMFG